MYLTDELYLGAVYDALYSLGYHPTDFYINLKPMTGYSHFVSGPAFTTKGRRLDKNENFAELDQLKYALYDPKYFVNNPFVILQANDNFCAHFGDINTLIYKKMGAVGFITDGNIRDAEIIDKYKFPIFCKDINPIDSLNHWILTELDVPIHIQNVLIESCDWIYASKEGVIRVKKKDELVFLEKLKLILEKEKIAREFISNIKDLENLSNLLRYHSSQNGRW